jgi:LmbE family N-acetylglucosaminyl deacetylase
MRMIIPYAGSSVVGGAIYYRGISLINDHLARFVGQLQDAGAGVLFVSPHLDDAVFSCGALLARLARTCPVTVVSVFTAAAPPARSGLAARKQLRGVGGIGAEAHFAERRAEDIAVLEQAGAAWVHLGFRDALFRRVGEAPAGPPGRGRAAYPTFRFHAGRGRIAPSDAGLAEEAGARIACVMRAIGAATVFGPLGVGRHVDHVITRRAVTGLGARTVYFSDFPYSQKQRPDGRFVQGASLAPYPWTDGRAENARRIAGYRTQVPGMFPHGVPISPEVYWIPANDSATAA